MRLERTTREALLICLAPALLLTVMVGGALGVTGCATVGQGDQGAELDRALARAEVSLEVTELALAVWDEQAAEHPEIDKWQEERDRLAAAVKEARAVVVMLRRLYGAAAESEI